ncbi:MAG: electron transfer flavoprotein subunit beta/FixA family protein [Oscillospiraceae bacterium]|nr:electron transfer flavoprotein subunit beta/FixA family protein [Oscillospiraceae bacterium]
MKILVCVKQVPDTSGKVAVNEDGTLNRASMPVITNPDDKNAVEAALKLKDAYGCKVILVTMGPMAAESMLRELLAMGADEAYLLSDRAFGGSDTFATSQVIAAALHHIGIDQDDIVICGRQAIDGDTAQVGPQIAEKLDLPQITYAGAMTYENGTVRVQRMLEDGYMTIEADTPCLVTCIKELNEPRYMTISGIYDCFAKPITVLTYDDLKDEPLIDVSTIGLKGSPTNIAKSFTPPPKGAGVMLEGADDTAVVSDLVSRLTEKHVL